MDALEITGELPHRNQSDYAPSSRRPVLAAFRYTANRAVRVCVRHNIHADTISYLSIVAAGAAAICFWLAGRHAWLLLAGPLFCYGRLWCNMLDGMVAHASGKASRRGEILNDVPDRISDVLIFAGVAYSGLNSIAAGYWAAILALFTAYIGVFGQALGARREYGGAMSKPWRMVVLHAGAWITLGSIWFGKGDIRWGGLTILDWTCLAIVAGCLQTIYVRLRRIMETPLAAASYKGKD